MKFDLGICGALILSAHNDFSPFVGSVGIRDGRIVQVSKEPVSPSECDEWIDGSDRILMPGLVNAHCHGDMMLAKGFGDDLTLQEQNETFGDTNWFYSLITDEDRCDSRLLTYAESLLAGTTFQLENMYWGLGARSAQVMKQSGINGALAEDIRRDYMKPEEFIGEEERSIFLDSCRASGRLPVIGSISEEDYAPELSARIRKIVQDLGIRQTFHMAETTWRVDLIKQRYGTTPVTWLYEQELLGPDVIGSHVVQVNDKEIGYLAETGTSVANTPLCEMKIADGIAPIAAMVRAGVNVCLGTDGAMWNNSSDIFREMKGMALLQTIRNGIRTIGTKDILRMATINGAKAFGMENEIGTVEEGKAADLILIRTDTPHMQPLYTGLRENVTSAVVFSAAGNDVTDVLVGGQRIVRDCELQTVELPELMQRVRSVTERIAAHYEERRKTS